MTYYNADGIAAPRAVKIEKDGHMVWLMNPAADPAWREEHGYTLTERPPMPPIPQTIYTKLQIRRAMRSLGIEERLDALLASSATFAADWADAQEIDLADPVLMDALAAGGITDAEIEQIREAM